MKTQDQVKSRISDLKAHAKVIVGVLEFAQRLPNRGHFIDACRMEIGVIDAEIGALEWALVQTEFPAGGGD